MTPDQVIAEAKKNGFCRIKHRTYLWQTKEASEAIKLEGVTTRYILIVDGDWSTPVPIGGTKSRELIRACSE